MKWDVDFKEYSFLMMFILFQALAFMYSIWEYHLPLPDSSKPRCLWSETVDT